MQKRRVKRTLWIIRTYYTLTPELHRFKRPQ